jgi:DNA-binding winged helix-turn-helix (wHTH) protein
LLSGLSNEVIAFGEFRLEPGERRLSRAGQPLDCNARYFDALLLLASHPGELITKDRFMAEVWKGIPVTDEALTQCIRSLRRLLGDEPTRPRFIETIPRHGYRFVADVTTEAPPSPASPRTLPPATEPTHHDLKVDSSFKSPAPASLLLLAGAGLAGGAAAGLVGGIGYGLLAATEPPAGTGAISIVLVLTCLCLLVGLLGGLGVGSGIAAARRLLPPRLFPLMAGGALGGLLIGSVGRLVGIDAFSLLVGSRPAAITGAGEGMVLGALAGAAAWIALSGRYSLQQAAIAGAALGAIGGLLVALGGGQMMAGSLMVLASAHPGAPLGSLVGGLPATLGLASSAVEGAVFVGALSLAWTLVGRQGSRSPRD